MMLSVKPWKADAIIRLGLSVMVCVFAGSLLASAGHYASVGGKANPKLFYALAAVAMACLVAALLLIATAMIVNPPLSITSQLNLENSPDALARDAQVSEILTRSLVLSGFSFPGDPLLAKLRRELPHLDEGAVADAAMRPRSSTRSVLVPLVPISMPSR